MKDQTARGVLAAAGWAVLSAPAAAGLTALAWQFPVIIAGNSGGSLGAAYGAAFTMVVYMTVFSFFAGVAAIGAVGAGAGFLVRKHSAVVSALAGVPVGILAALIVAVAGAYLSG